MRRVSCRHFTNSNPTFYMCGLREVCVDSINKVERNTRIELAPHPWEGRVLPLY